MVQNLKIFHSHDGLLWGFRQDSDMEMFALDL